MTQNKFSKSIRIICICVILLAQVVLVMSAWSDTSQHKSNKFTGGGIHDVVLTKRSVAEDGSIISDALAGAIFELYQVGNPDEKLGQLFSTDERGEIWVRNLAPGSYYFYEVTPPLGHDFEKDDSGQAIQKYPFIITGTEDDQPIHVEARNVQVNAYLDIVKTIINTNGEPLSEAQRNESFQFQIRFNEKITDPAFVDETVYYYVVDEGDVKSFTNGDTIQLKHGQRARFINLPYGTRYDVQEIADHEYIISSTHASGYVYDKPIASFVNSTPCEQFGIATIRKTVVNASGTPISEEQKNKKFTFTITFSDGGTYPVNIPGETTMMLKSGESIELGHGQNAYIMKLPLGVTYTIKEKDYSDEGYYSQMDTIEGSITSNSELIFYDVVNVYDDGSVEDGTLFIKKNVLDTQRKDTFKFYITFDAEGEYTYRINDGEVISFVNGDAIEINPSETIKFESLPMGLRYHIREAVHPDYQARIEVQEGYIASEQNMVSFWNRYIGELADHVALTIEKRVEGQSTDQAFEFILHHGENNQESFTLKDKETKTFSLPKGTIYTVEEKDYTQNGYELFITNSHGTLEEGKNIHVLATNKYRQELEQIEISGEKTWRINPSDLGQMPESIVVYLKNDDGMVIATKTVSADDEGNWKYTFIAPKFDAQGKEVKYRVEEALIPYFEATYDKYDIVNTYKKPVSYLPKIIKEISGNTPTDAEHFKFVLTPLGMAPLGGKGAITLEGAGEAYFSELVFTEAGVYRYRIEEIAGTNEAYVYDKTKVLLSITTRINEHGSLEISDIVYEKNGYESSNSHALFVNEYVGQDDTNTPIEEPNDPLEDPVIPNEKPNDDLPATGVSANKDIFIGILIALFGINLILLAQVRQLRKKQI